MILIKRIKTTRLILKSHINIPYGIFILLLSVHIITMDNFISAQKNAFHS